MILVAGATGNVGRHIVASLVENGQSVRALSRDPLRAIEKLPVGVEAVEGDLREPESLRSALTAVTAVHLINFGGDDYQPLQTGPEIVALLEEVGVKRVTLLRGGVEKTRVEEALEASNLAWTYIQPVEFMSGGLEWAGEIKAEGRVKAPFPHAKSAMVHDGDIGAVAAKILTEDGHGGQTYTLTGPEALTKPQKVQIIANALGREIEFVELNEAQAREKWAAEGLPQDVIEFFVWAHGSPPEMAFTVVPTVEQILGRPARTFGEWAAEHVEAFR